MHNKGLRVLCCAFALSVAMSTSAYAAQSLSDLTGGNNTQTESSTNSNNEAEKDTREYQIGDSKVTVDTHKTKAVDILSQATDFSNSTETVNKMQKSASPLVSQLIQILIYIATTGLVVVKALELVYMAIPPLRPMLDGGKSVGMQGNTGGMSGGMSGGFGGMSGGYGGGFGGMSGGYGGMNGGFGGMSGGGMQSAQQRRGTCFVSDAVIRAANDPNGVQWGMYFKDTAVTSVMLAVLGVLLITGVLPKLGFTIGSIISNGISSAI